MSNWVNKILFLIFLSVSLLTVNPQPPVKNKYGTIKDLLHNIKTQNYKGKEVEIDFYKTDVKDILKTLLKYGGFSALIEQNIKTHLNMTFKKIRWDKALALALNIKGLEMVYLNKKLFVRKSSQRIKKYGFREKGNKYRGERGDFEYFNADLNHVILSFAKVYKLNIVIDPGIEGKVTCRLRDVPWDQALDVILTQHGLGIINLGKSYKIVRVRK